MKLHTTSYILSATLFVLIILTIKAVLMCLIEKPQEIDLQCPMLSDRLQRISTYQRTKTALLLFLKKEKLYSKIQRYCRFGNTFGVFQYRNGFACLIHIGIHTFIQCSQVIQAFFFVCNQFRLICLVNLFLSIQHFALCRVLYSACFREHLNKV